MALFGPSDAVINALSASVTVVGNRLNDLAKASQANTVAVQANTAGDAARLQLLTQIQAQNHADQLALQKLIHEAATASFKFGTELTKVLVQSQHKLTGAIDAHTDQLKIHGLQLKVVGSAAELAAGRLEGLTAKLDELILLLKAADEPEPRLEINIGLSREQNS